MSTEHLAAPARANVEDEFGGWLETVVDTAVKPIVRRKLHVSLLDGDTRKRNQDALELVGDVRVTLLVEVQRTGPVNGLIRNFAAYAGTVTSNACYQYLRAQFPERTRLRNKLRYILTHNAKFAVWKSPENNWLCGIAEWDGREVSVAPAAGGDDPKLAGNEREIVVTIAYSFFLDSGGPVLFDDLVEHVASLRGLAEPYELSDDLDGVRDLTPDPCLRADRAVELMSRLNALWVALLELPIRHRQALLLNLRDGGGENLLVVLPLGGVASIREIAVAMDMTFEQLADIWNSLPWDDLRIAKHLGLTRQQVINLRQTGRAKLTRWRNETGNI